MVGEQHPPVQRAQDEGERFGEGRGPGERVVGEPVEGADEPTSTSPGGRTRSSQA